MREVKEWGNMASSRFLDLSAYLLVQWSIACFPSVSRRANPYEKRREMLNLPKKMMPVLRHFEEVFSERVWEWAKVLLNGLYRTFPALFLSSCSLRPRRNLGSSSRTRRTSFHPRHLRDAYLSAFHLASHSSGRPSNACHHKQKRHHHRNRLFDYESFSGTGGPRTSPCINDRI